MILKKESTLHLLFRLIAGVKIAVKNRKWKFIYCQQSNNTYKDRKSTINGTRKKKNKKEETMQKGHVTIVETLIQLVILVDLVRDVHSWD